MPDNTITVVGNITRDPELKFLNSGQAAVRLSVAVNRRWQNRQTQEWEERVSYFEVTGYGSMAENAANSLTKGTRVLVTGRLEALHRRDQRRRDRAVAQVRDRRRHPDPSRGRIELPAERRSPDPTQQRTH
jgi:single-strand DNA-binding protein